MTARDEARRRFPATLQEWSGTDAQPGWYTTEVQFAFEAGVEYQRTQEAPLIEAARAYRDAKAAFDMAGPPSAVHATGEELLDARDELCEAARTFEVSHEEQG
jgi:hypothetical protein